MITHHLFVDETNKQYTVFIGRNKNENHILINSSHPNDLWFHLENQSSPHIVVQTKGDTIPKKYINSILRFFPMYKSNLPSRFRVIYTEIKNLKTTSTPGTVIPTNIKIIKS